VGITYRHLFVIRNAPRGSSGLRTVPPHEIVGERVSDNLVKPERNKIARILNDLILGSKQILSDHPVNIARVESGKRPANMIWIWGQGKKPRMESLVEKYGIKGAIISAVNVVKGVGACAGMSRFEVPGATGFYDTNYENKARFALKALEDHDLVLVHVEAPDEAGHAGDIEEKIKAIENIDSRLIGKVIDGLEGDYIITVTADHGTPISARVHVADPVPVAVYSTIGRGDSVRQFDEFSAARGSFGILDGYKLMGKLLRPLDTPSRR
jgi:2,3-bisphosphoglycerate-independent phosphoglycerate mutase